MGESGGVEAVVGVGSIVVSGLGIGVGGVMNGTGVGPLAVPYLERHALRTIPRTARSTGRFTQVATPAGYAQITGNF